MIRRVFSLVFVLYLLSSAASAHFFAVRMQALFPTATRPGVKLTMRTKVFVRKAIRSESLPDLRDNARATSLLALGSRT